VLIVDDILVFPFRGLLWIFRELYDAARRELAAEAESITAELGKLYMMLETGSITETEFDAREKDLLDRLEKIKDPGAYIAEEGT
jgi:beta-galactosidase GanA